LGRRGIMAKARYTGKELLVANYFCVDVTFVLSIEKSKIRMNIIYCDFM